MSTLSVPLPAHLEAQMTAFIKSGHETTKAAIARMAIAKFLEDEAVLAVLEAEQEVREGKIIRGDLRDIIKKSTF